RVQAAELGAHDRARLAAEPLLDGAQREFALGEAEDLLHDHGGRPHAGDGNHERVILERVGGDDLRRAAAPQSLFEQQPADVRIAAAACAEKRCAAGEIASVFQCDLHHASTNACSSPMAFTRTRTAPPGRYCNGSSSMSAMRTLSGAAPASRALAVAALRA